MVFQAILLGVELFFWGHIRLLQEINKADVNVSKEAQAFLAGVSVLYSLIWNKQQLKNEWIYYNAFLAQLK